MRTSKLTIAFKLLPCFLLLILACDDSSSPEIKIPNANDFLAVPHSESISLSWTKPAGMAGVVIIRSTERVPQSLSDGEEIYRGTESGMEDTGLSNGTLYYYAAFTFDASDNYSESANAAAVPFRQIEMVPIPAGSFLMGSNWEHDPENPDSGQGFFADEMPVHTVHLDAFLMSNTEVTQAQYEFVMEGYVHFAEDDLPVAIISWDDAMAFCNKLSEKEGLEPCYIAYRHTCDYTKNGYRLPTEAEWEYACLAGTTTRYYSGNDESDLDMVGWYSGNSGGAEIFEVASKPPNAWGLYDMHGNVSEHCANWDGEYTILNETNPTGPADGTRKMLRGGSCYDSAANCRATNRQSIPINGTSGGTGIRLVRRP